MSFLAEILATADKVEMGDLNVKVNEVSDMVLSLKLEVMETMENAYVKFVPYFKENSELLKRANSLFTEFTNLETRIDSQIKRDLSDSTGELQNLKSSLQEVDLNMSVAKSLCSIRECFVESGNKQRASNFFAAAQKLKETENLLICAKEKHLLDVHKALEDELVNKRSKFLYNVIERWRPCVKWNEVITDDNKKTKEITLSIIEGEIKSDLIKALHYYDMLIIEINKFGDKFLHNVLKPVIDKTTRVVVTEEEKVSTLLIKTKNVNNAHCVDVINNLVIVFKFLFSQFDISIDDSSTFITELGERICDEFIEYFIRNCLDKAVPKCQEKLDSYELVVQNLLQLEEILHEKGFLPSNNKQLLEYSVNVDALITKKICDFYLESARKLMKNDLQDMIEAGTAQENAEATFHGQDFRTVRKVKSYRPPNTDQRVLVSELSVNTYQLPVCRISKSAAELKELVKNLLDESAKSKTKSCAFKLFSMARDIFRLYCDIVPLQHKKMLVNFPQQAALLNNNCYYLSHNLMMMGAEFKAKLPVVLQGDMITFVDLIESLRNVGNRELSNQIELQKKRLVDILRDSGLVTVTESPKFPDEIEKGIRQCIRQLQLLQNVWHRVLPDNTYCESIGTLCHIFVQELVDRVCSFGDIPANTASELVRVFTIVLEKVPTVFPEPNEIFMHIKNWTKFNELVRLLGASLQDVEERWSDGKGPLALEFTADQVKLLVKALFQISDKRADLLARIK